jgi:membrane protein required for colicin V production
MGFMTGLLRTLATIIGYICGAGIAVAAPPKTVSLLANYPKIPTPQTWIVVVAIFIVAGVLISAPLRLIVSGMTGRNISVPDRMAGAALGGVRFAMLAIMLVLVFDRMFPPGREPAFLRGSQWRPVLSSAAQYQSLPPEAEDYLDREAPTAPVTAQVIEPFVHFARVILQPARPRDRKATHETTWPGFLTL